MAKRNRNVSKNALPNTPKYFEFKKGKSLSDIMGHYFPESVPSRDGDIEDTEVGMRRLLPTGEDFGPYFVDPATEYYQGPTRSTRVAAHQFIPLDGEMDKVESALGPQFQHWLIRGRIYVRFIKNNTLWQYGPCTLEDYRLFRESSSKGRSVRSLEVFGHGRATTQPNGLQI